MKKKFHAGHLRATMFIVVVSMAATIPLPIEAKILQDERRISWSAAGVPGEIPPEVASQIFTDVPPSHWASVYIETLFEGGIVAGCSTEPLMYCPDQSMLRAESAVFIERGIYGAGYLPAQPQIAIFRDVPLGEWFAKWADGLWMDGFTAGCGTDPLLFCPLRAHTRAEATVFFERMLHGKDFIPADPTVETYADVAVGPDAPWYSKWVAAAHNDNLLQDCEDENNRHDSLFRPIDGLTRAEAACMMMQAKDQLPPTPTPQPASGDGIWISREEIRALPIAGEPGCDSLCATAWDNLVSASRDIGGGNIGDQNESDDVRTLAAAIVAVRTQDDELRGKVVQALLDIIGTDELPDSHCDHKGNASAGRPHAGARSLAIARNLTAYIIASDIIGLRPGTDNGIGDQWAEYVDTLRFKPNCPNTGSGTYPDGDWFNLTEAHNEAGSNANAQAGGARLAAALFLGDMPEVERAWDTFKRYSGDCGGGPCGFHINSSGQSWSFDSAVLAPINPVNAIKKDQNGVDRSIDGAIIADIGRGGDFKWPPGHTNYPWVGLEGYIVQALLLDRAGYPAWSVGDSAPYRAVAYLKLLSEEFGDQWWERTHWVKYVLNSAYGVDFPAGVANSGHVMAWTDWTHRNR